MKRAILLLMSAAALLTGCGNGVGPGSQISLSFSGGASVSSPNPGFLSAPSIADGANALVITKAEVVLREIELKRVEVVDCDVIPEPDGCEKFEVGPVLINLPVDGTTSTEITIEIDPGSYTEIEFDIHKVSNDDPEDAAFRTAHPDLLDTSIRVKGTFNGVVFTYVTDLNEAQKFDLVRPLVIDENTASTNVTIVLDLATWFVDAQGNLIDPSSANKGGDNENLVRDNIRASIEAFEDRDKDGSKD
jgi:hypothetical protein